MQEERKNHNDVIMKVSELSGINVDDCQHVIVALEQVLSDELSHSKNVSGAFNKVYTILHFLKGKKG